MKPDRENQKHSLAEPGEKEAPSAVQVERITGEEAGEERQGEGRQPGGQAVRAARDNVEGEPQRYRERKQIDDVRQDLERLHTPIIASERGKVAIRREGPFARAPTA